MDVIWDGIEQEFSDDDASGDTIDDSIDDSDDDYDDFNFGGGPISTPSSVPSSSSYERLAVPILLSYRITEVVLADKMVANELYMYCFYHIHFCCGLGIALVRLVLDHCNNYERILNLSRCIH